MKLSIGGQDRLSSIFEETKRKGFLYVEISASGETFMVGAPAGSSAQINQAYMIAIKALRNAGFSVNAIKEGGR